MSFKQGRINHWANRANARGLAFEYQNTPLLLFYVSGCSPSVKIAEHLITAFSRLHTLRKLTTLEFIVFEWFEKIVPNSTTFYDPRMRSESVHLQASAENFSGGATSKLCLSFSSCWRSSRVVASGGPVVPAPPSFEIVGPPVAAYIQYCVLKMWLPLLVFDHPCYKILATDLRSSAKGFLQMLYPFYPISLCWLNLNS